MTSHKRKKKKGGKEWKHLLSKEQEKRRKRWGIHMVRDQKLGIGVPWGREKKIPERRGGENPTG